jgi:hypothetical protein
MVVACLALLVALGGTSYATVLQVPRNSVGPLQLKRNAVGPAKIAPNTIRTGHVQNGSLLTDDFKAGQIPQGPKGEKGDKGEKGEKGDAGTAGVSGYEIVTRVQSVTNSHFNNLTVSCPAGKKVIGGGGNVGTTAGEGPLVYRSFPGSNEASWTVSSTRSPVGSWGMTGYAICISVK